MFANINLAPILISMAVVAVLLALVGIGLVVAAVVAVRRALHRRALKQPDRGRMSSSPLTQGTLREPRGSMRA